MLSKIIDESYVRETRALLMKAENIVIVSHVAPDGDAVGATLGMYHFLKEKGKKATIILPNSFPSFLNWMEGSSDIIIYEENQEQSILCMKDSDLILLIDFNELSRIDGLKPLVQVSGAKKILIDHHPNPTEIADVIISYPNISSSCELVFRLICRMGYSLEINKACAESIYTGMMTDTGAFSYNSNNDEIYFIIYILIQKGIDKDLIYRNVYENYTESRMRMMGYCLSEKMKIYPEYHTALITLTGEEQKRFNLKSGDTEGIVNLPFSIQDIRCCVFIREDVEHARLKLSFRSQGDMPVNKMAQEHFGGGGHLNAAGGESNSSMEECVDLFEHILSQYKEFLQQ